MKLHGAKSILCLLAMLGAVNLVASQQASSPAPYAIDELAPGVSLFRPVDDSIPRTNSLVIERDDGLLVVDAQPSPQAARDLLEQLRQLSPRTPRYLVLSHAHAEAAGGASAFPHGILIISSTAARDQLLDPAHDFGAETRIESSGDGVWNAPPRPAVTLVLEARTQLDDPRIPVELMPLPPSHSIGDLAVFVPHLNLYYVGAVLPGLHDPYAAAGNVGGWISALNHLARERPEILVPLRGKAATPEDARTARDAFSWVQGRVRESFIEQIPRDEIVAWVLDSKAMPEFFKKTPLAVHRRSFVTKVLDEALENRRKRGFE